RQSSSASLFHVKPWGGASCVTPPSSAELPNSTGSPYNHWPEGMQTGRIRAARRSAFRRFPAGQSRPSSSPDPPGASGDSAMQYPDQFDVLVIGGGHAGTEAAL